MSEASDVRSVQCSECGAPLELHGGHKVRSLVCGYCGSIMDAHKDYQKIKAYKNAGDRPASPFKLGMKGLIKNVEFTLIGMLEYDSEGDRWLDFQLYSPTHGYAWLSQSQGHYSFSRKIREIPQPSQIKDFRLKKRVHIKDKNLQLFETYSAKIVYAEGELTWIAKRGATSEIIDAINPPYGFSYEKNNQELEYSWEEYLDIKQLFKDFGLEVPNTQAQGVHALQPYPKNTFWASMGAISPSYFFGSLFILVVVWLFNDTTTLLNDKQPAGKISIDQTFTLSKGQANALLQLKLLAKPTKNTENYELEIFDSNQKRVFNLAEHINSHDLGTNKHWSTDAGIVETWLRLDSGTYHLKVTTSPTIINLDTTPQIPVIKSKLPAIQINIEKQGLSISFLLYLVLFIFILLFIASYKETSFESQRWNDKDDDD